MMLSVAATQKVIVVPELKPSPDRFGETFLCSLEGIHFRVPLYSAGGNTMKKYARSLCAKKMLFVTTGLTMALLVSHARAQDITPLEPGKLITRTAKARDAHNYSLPLTAGQFIRVLVEQDTVDVSVDLIAPDNKPVHMVNNSRFWGTESLSWEAAISGTYKLVVRALSSPQSEGSYQIQLGIKDSATAPDKQRIAAEQAMSEITRTGPRALPPEQKAEKHKEALRLWQSLGDMRQEANAHEVMGMSYDSDRKYEQARESFKQALAIKQELQDHLGRIYTLSNLGVYVRQERSLLRLGISERGKQLLSLDEEYHQQALALSREIKHRGAERFILSSLAEAYRSQPRFDKAIATLKQILAMDRESKNRADEAASLHNLGGVSVIVQRGEEARRYYEKALTIFRELKDRTGEANALMSLGSITEVAEIGIRQYELALAIFRELKDRRGEAACLRGMGTYNTLVRRYENVLPFYEEALVIYRELQDGASIERLINITFVAAGRAGRYETAQRYFDEYLAIFRNAKDRKGEAEALFKFANGHTDWGRFEKALDYYNAALSIYLELKDLTNEAAIYKNIAVTTTILGRYEQSIESQEKAVAIWRELKNDSRLSTELSNLAGTYLRLNRSEKAIEYLEEAIAMGRKIKNSFFEAGTLSEAGALVNLGDVNINLGLYGKAIDYYEQSLTLYRGIKYVRNEGQPLWGIGLALYRLGQPEKAIEYYEQSLGIIRQIRNRYNESLLLADYAEALRSLGQTEKAINTNLAALRIARELKARDAEAMALNGLQQDWSLQNQPQLASFFGKQSVNLYQDIRSGLRTLDQETQRSFLHSKEQTYRELADLLVSQDRLPEAEQVIRLLKEEEYFEYVRRDQNNSPKGEKAALTPEEAAIEKRYREIADQLTILGTERGELLGKPSRTAQEESRLAKLEADLTVAGRAFQTFLDGLSAEFAKKTDGQTRVIQVREAQGLMEDLRDLGKGTVALYTLVGENKFRVILTTPDVQKAYEANIKGADLNRKVLALREALQNPRLDPRPAAQELYQILFVPLAKDLEQMKAKTLMWSLDGVLRYVPVAALYDGKQYLVERFQHTIFTPVSKARLKDEPSRNWKALGLGVTKSFGPNIPALPAVADEMRGIIKDEPNGKGILPGTIKLDDQFTFEAMKTGLRQRPPVVHVASHFRFKPGDETDSALLLGDGQFLSLAQIKDLPSPFGGVELLTLSACNTATGGSNANGKEVEGFGVLAQRQGAKAVVASLWPVADRSTKNLMQEFYRLREAKANSTKAEAMRQAQIKLLRGELQITGEAVAARDITHETGKATNLPPYKVDPKAPYAHPYYWAPFILIGNWK